MVLETAVDESALSRLAEALALDPAPILERMQAPEVQAVIDANYELAQRLGISGTPTFVMGEQLVRGYVALPQMQAIVAAER
jgi:protein-disulfide isomerase